MMKNKSLDYYHTQIQYNWHISNVESKTRQEKSTCIHFRQWHRNTLNKQSLGASHWWQTMPPPPPPPPALSPQSLPAPLISEDICLNFLSHQCTLFSSVYTLSVLDLFYICAKFAGKNIEGAQCAPQGLGLHISNFLLFVLGESLWNEDDSATAYAPLEIRSRERERTSEEIHDKDYLTATKAGEQAVFRTRLMLVGQARVGKTSLKKALTGGK